jgi:hypothetical protein
MRKTNKMQKRPRKLAKKGGRKTKKIQKHRKNRYKNKIRGGAQTENIINTAFSPNANLEEKVKDEIPLLNEENLHKDWVAVRVEHSYQNLAKMEKIIY